MERKVSVYPFPFGTRVFMHRNGVIREAEYRGMRIKDTGICGNNVDTEHIFWFSATGKAMSSENRLLLEVPEYTTFKDGDVLSNEDGSYIFILNTNGKYLTSLYASLTIRGGLTISDDIAANENNIERYRLATDSEKQMMINALKASKNPKAKEYLKRFFGIEEKPKYEFKPFDKVLVRDEDDKEWNISLFAREIVDDYNGLPYKYECSNGTLWDYCIHFEGNEHLLGTDEAL